MNAEVSWIILTMGDRPIEVRAAVDSIRAQSVAADEILVLGNGVDLEPIDGATVVSLPENLGICEGRNEGARRARSEILFFLDDDARCLGTDITEAVLAAFEARADLAAVSMRIVDEASGVTQRRHVPRLRAGDPMRGGDVTTFLGGACAIRRHDFEAAGGYPGPFFYAMEETDLAWGLLDLGRSIHYLPAAAVHHPATVPARHGAAFVRTARNRVWLARRRLPLVLRPIYLAVWSTLMLVRAPSGDARRDVVRGLRDGVTDPAPPSTGPMRWSTVWRMARLGRPPVI
ncbi:MAG: glycosyltransferase [Actinomycetota bacterium]